MYVLSPYYYLLLFANCIIFCVLPLVLLWFGFVYFNVGRTRRTGLFDPRWDGLTYADWDAFALAWIAELSGNKPPPLPNGHVLFSEDPESTASDFVVPMCFTASVESQWRFIDSVFRHGNDETMRHLAAGPVEHLLSKHGDANIERFEKLAHSDSRFAQMLKGCYKNSMSDAVWDRLCAARGQVGAKGTL